VKFKVRKEPFGLSLSKPFALGTEASTGSAWPFDKLRANGGGKPTVVNARNGPIADLRIDALARDASPKPIAPVFFS
jgi:hypothetical protein